MTRKGYAESWSSFPNQKQQYQWDMESCWCLSGMGTEKQLKMEK